MNYIGFLVTAFGLYAAMTLEHLPLHIFYAPSAICLILFMGLGGTLVSYRWAEIRRAVSACFDRATPRPKEDWLTYSRIFSLLSNYTFAAGWMGVILGTIHVLGSVEEVDGDIGKLAAGLALAFLCPLIGTLISKFLFDPMRNFSERKALDTGPASAPVEQAAAPAPTPNLLFRIVLFSASALVLLAIAVMVSWKVGSMQAEHRRDRAATNPDTAPVIHRDRTTILDTFLLGTKQKPGLDISIRDQGKIHRLRCTVYLGYSRDYNRSGSGFFEELRSRTPMLREIVIRVLGNKTADELQPQHLDAIEDELLSRINEVLNHGTVVDIMFSEYVVD